MSTEPNTPAVQEKPRRMSTKNQIRLLEVLVTAYGGSARLEGNFLHYKKLILEG